MRCWNLFDLNCPIQENKFSWELRILHTSFLFLFFLVVLKNKRTCWRVIHLIFIDFISNWTPFSCFITVGNRRALTRWIIDICQANFQITVEVDRIALLGTIVPEGLDGECLGDTVIGACIRQGFWHVFTHSLVTTKLQLFEKRQRDYSGRWPLTSQSS